MTAFCVAFNYQQKAIFGVHGYLRENVNRFKCMNMPRDLVELITTWYGTIDYWDINKMHSSYDLASISNSIQRRNEYDGSCYQSFGSLNIKMGDIKVWKLRLLDIDPVCTNSTALIGIIDSKKVDGNLNGDFCDRVNNGYGVSLFEGSKYFKEMQGFKYAEQVQIDDVVVMELNMTNPTNCTLKYSVLRNGYIRDYGVAFWKIDGNIQWRLAIGMYYRENIQLIK